MTNTKFNTKKGRLQLHKGYVSRARRNWLNALDDNTGAEIGNN